MAFTVYKTDDGHVPATEYLPAGAITPKVGMLLYVNSGLLTAAGGSHAPKYVCMTQRSAAVSSGTKIPVIRITPDIIFKTEADGAGTAVIGGLYDIASGGMKVDIDASTYDNFELTGAEASSTVSGTVLYGRIVA